MRSEAFRVWERAVAPALIRLCLKTPLPLGEGIGGGASDTANSQLFPPPSKVETRFQTKPRKFSLGLPRPGCPEHDAGNDRSRPVRSIRNSQLVITKSYRYHPIIP